ncbi:hypothetical protein A4X13_0g6402 [Tilletia indica]|uniref:CCHC-type domain-containing protein n=1 Tax=Tilletia indica TaxID=43049 RepID=A0A177TTB8_9BASI|nr:hypothetical protein A4X13_0g6402 [Tilletia indica]
MSAANAKILVVGPPAGQLQTLISKTNAINNKHGPFDALFILGNLFSPDTAEEEAAQLINKSITCTIPTYFTLGTHPLPQLIQHIINDNQPPVQIANNLTYLGQAGIAPITATATGASLNLAFLGGQWDPAAWSAAPTHDTPLPPSTDEEGEKKKYSPHHITPHLIHNLLSHPALALSKQPPRKLKPTRKQRKPHHHQPVEEQEQQPTTLAEARAQQAAKLAALTSSILPPPPAGLPVEEEPEPEEEEQKEEGHRPPAIDILLLPYFPSGILNSPPPPKDTSKGKRKSTPAAALTPLDPSTYPHPSIPSWGAPPLATLIARARPRYAFALGPSLTTDSLADLPPDAEQRLHGTFFERLPYLNPVSTRDHKAGGGGPVTRFISLANLGNEKKVRWFMALNLPLVAPGGAAQTIPLPPNVTASPYGMLGFERVVPPPPPSLPGMGQGTSGRKALPSQEDSAPNFRFAVGGNNGRNGGQGQGGIPPKSYICRLCSEPGHYIQDCELASGAPAKDPSGQEKVAGAGEKGGSSIVPPEGYECRICLSPTHLVQRCPFSTSSSTSSSSNKRPRHETKTKKEVAIPVGPKDCWFCLSNPACARHLVVGIGSEVYVALPKGQLVRGVEEGGKVPGGGHVLIIPINHTPSYLSPNLSSTDSQSLQAERALYLRALSALYASQNCIPLSWEIGRSEGATHTRVGHTHTQVVPVPRELCQNWKDVWEGKAREAGYELLSDAKTLSGFFEGSNKEKVADYFRMQIGVDGGEEGGTTTTFLIVLRGAQARFNMQWPRQTLAALLNTPERADWRVCARPTEDEERREAEQFKAAFQPFAAEIAGDDDDSDDDDEEDDGQDGVPDEEGY